MNQLISATERSGAVACTVLLGILIACLPTFLRISQARLYSRLLLGRQRRNSSLRSREPIDLQTVYPTLPVRAILWLLWHPWEGSRGWPNAFPFQKPRCKNRMLHPNAPTPKKHLSFSAWATCVLWLAQTQLAILLRESLMRLCGKRPRDRSSHTMSHHNAARMSEMMASLCSARETNREAMMPLEVSDSYGSIKMPNARAEARRENPKA